MDDPAELCLRVRDLHASYGREIPPGERGEPLRGVSLDLYRGEMVAVLGPNGAGKSTLLRVLAGTLAPSSGEVRLFGSSVADLPRRARAQELAVVGQTQEMSFGFTTREVVMMGRAPHQDGWMRARADDERIVDEVLARCELVDLASRAVHELSGGEQKRVAIARALAQRPKAMLLDEPSAFLDVRHQVALYDLLDEEISRSGLACMVVMHDLNLAAQYASRVALMKDGRLVSIGKIDEVMTYARLRETFDADLYCGVNELSGSRFFLPMRKSARDAGPADS